MQTIRLRVNDKIFKNFMWLLSRFDKEEIQVVKENHEFLSIQQYLESELNNIETNKAEFIDIDRLDKDLDATIRKYEA